MVLEDDGQDFCVSSAGSGMSQESRTDLQELTCLLSVILHKQITQRDPFPLFLRVKTHKSLEVPNTRGGAPCLPPLALCQGGGKFVRDP